MDTLLQELEFLRESNFIEGVYDEQSLHDAKRAWDALIERKSLSPTIIKRAHKVLMVNQPLPVSAKGEWRREGVRIGQRYGKPWYALPELIEQWCIRANASKTEEEIKADHVAYEEIHPFLDGNGRTGRMFMNWQRVRNGLPILVIKEKEKHEYYKWFTESESIQKLQSKRIPDLSQV